jgi:replicative DNA helicase
LDALLGGGVNRQSLNVVMAHTRRGKSVFLINVAATLFLLRKSVVYFTLELSEEKVLERLDLRLSGYSQEQVIYGDSLERFWSSLAFARRLSGEANLYIKKFPTKKASVVTLETHLAKLESAGIVPDVVIVDYGDLMRSVRPFKEKRDVLESVFEDLRTIGEERDIPIWTATQARRLDKEQGRGQDLTIEEVQEGYGKVQVADVVITLSQSETDEQSQLLRLTLGKSRDGNEGMTVKAKFFKERCLLRGFAEFPDED